MKKLISLILAAMLLLTLVACNGRFLRFGGVFPAAIGNAYPEHGDSRKADDGNRRGVRAL